MYADIEHGERTAAISEDYWWPSAMRGRDGIRGRAGWAACRQGTLCRRARRPTARASRAPACASARAAAAPDSTRTRPHSRLPVPAARAPSATARAGTGSRAPTRSGTRGRTPGKTDDASPGPSINHTLCTRIICKRRVLLLHTRTNTRTCTRMYLKLEQTQSTEE